MGSVGSAPSKESEDPWWRSGNLQENNDENVPKQDLAAPDEISEDGSRNTCEFGEESWLKQIQDLGKVVQHLASENVRLLVANKELRQKCEGMAGERKIGGRISDTVCQSVANDNTVTYVEALNVKLCEYQHEIEKLKKDFSEKDETMKDLQYLLQTTDDERRAAEGKAQEVNTMHEAMKSEYAIIEDKFKCLQGQISDEKEQQRQLLEENERLSCELRTLKEQLISDSALKAGVSDCIKAQAFVEEAAPISNDASKEEQSVSLSPRAAAELESFQNRLKIKREARHRALSAISAEMERLRRELNTEREARRNAVRELENIKNMIDKQHVSLEVDHLRCKLSSEHEEKEKISRQLVQIQKQGSEEIENVLKELKKERAKTEYMQGENKCMKEQLEESDQMLQQKSEENSHLQTELETQKEKYQQQVSALKEVISLSKQLLAVRERQVDYLKQTLENIEVSVVEKRHGSLSAGLKAEYETQMQNIKTLKALYEERTVIMNAEKEKLLEHQKGLFASLNTEKRKTEDLELKLQEKDAVISERNETVSSLQDQLSDSLDQCRNLSRELTLINNMFTQILGSNDMDLDRLTKLLQENHDLITEITTKGDSSEVTASLPKLLLDLISDIEVPDRVPSKMTEAKTEHEEEENATAIELGEQDEARKDGITLGMQDISSNLPKVWRVLMELISHHVEPTCSDFSPEECKATCYKSIETPYGPKNVISVSKTFLRIRDLIIHKTSLQKEVTRLKQLNVHLETKLNDQERRLSLVSSELRKTWNVVDQMHIQHQQLHTHEKVLRYELQQKRKLLQQLKEELEYCREKWEEARKKNCQTEVDWRNLRKEFAMRKLKPDSPLNNSEESGFSDEKEDYGSDCDTPITTKKRGSDVNSQHTASAGEEKEPIQDSHSSASLPDLVSATADLPLSEADIPSPRTSSPLSVQVEENTSHLPSNIPGQDPSEHEECPTASLISLLKLQLSCFSKNLEIITAGLDNHENLRALQSIFTLPAIQIPEHLHPIPNPNYDSPSTSYANNLVNSDTSVSRDEIASTKTFSSVRQEETKSEMSSYKAETQAESCSNKCSTFNDNQLGENVVNLCASSCSTSSPQSCVVSNDIPSSPESPDCADVGSLLVQGLTNGRINIRQPQESRSERLKRLEKQCQELFQKVTQTSASATQEKSIPPSASPVPAQEPARNLEDMLDARAARLKRLEEESQQLFKKVTRTTHRSEALSGRLEELHEQYGSEDSGSSSSDTQVSTDSTPVKTSQILSSYIPQPPPLPVEPLDQAAALPQNFTGSSRSLEEVLEARAARMRRLEEESQKLFKKVTRTTHRSEALSNRLEELHEQYGCGNNGPNCPVSETSTAASGHENTSQSTSCHIPQPPPLPATPTAQVLISAESSSGSSRSFKDDLKAGAGRLCRLRERSLRLTETTQHHELLPNHPEGLLKKCENNVTEGNSENINNNASLPVPEAHTEQSLPSASIHLPNDCELLETSQATPCNIPTSSPFPSTSNEQATATISSSNGSTQSLEDRLDARAARLKRLEEQSQQLFKKVTRTTRRSTVLSNRLEELHEQYGNGEASAGVETTVQNSMGELSGQEPSLPPLPEVQRECELPTVASGQQTQEEISICPVEPASSSHIPLPPPLPSVLPSTRIPNETMGESDSQIANDLPEL